VAKQYEIANEAFTAKIREFVDEWLDSAWIEGGIETPHKRKLGRIGLSAVYEFREANKPTQYLREDGETELIFPLEHRVISMEGIEDPLADAEREAFRLFSDFMDEPESKARFAVCRACRVYYCNKKKLAETYERGTHCEACRSQVTAARSQQNGRLAWKKKALLLAADAWFKWLSKSRRDQRSRWIAAEMNKQLGRFEQIKKNWVTLNTKNWERLSIEEIQKQIRELGQSDGSL
jgi:hypothetical protein